MWISFECKSTARGVRWIVDADIRSYFDRLNRDWLVRFLEYRIGDRRVIRLIVKWLNAGVMEGGEWRDDLRGTPQGAIVSPILANVYLHYVLDLWFHKKWRARTARGNTIIVRYADDFVVGFQYQRDAERFLHDVKERMASFSLELHPDKTRLIEFGRFAQKNRRARGERRPETFDFLGLTHYCRTTRNGKFGLGRKPVGKRVDQTLRRIGAELRRRMHQGSAFRPGNGEAPALAVALAPVAELAHRRDLRQGPRPVGVSVPCARQAREHDRFLPLIDPQHQGREAIPRQGAERVEGLGAARGAEHRQGADLRRRHRRAESRGQMPERDEATGR